MLQHGTGWESDSEERCFQGALGEGEGPHPQAQEEEEEQDGLGGDGELHAGGDTTATCGTPSLEGDSLMIENRSPWGGGHSGGGGP